MRCNQVEEPAQGLNALVASLGPTAAWVGLQGAVVIGIALGLVTAASLPVAMVALATGALLGAILRFGR